MPKYVLICIFLIGIKTLKEKINICWIKQPVIRCELLRKKLDGCNHLRLNAYLSPQKQRALIVYNDLESIYY